MPTVTISTDKTQYAPGEQIVVTLDVQADAAVSKQYTARGSVVIDGNNYGSNSLFSVVDESSVGAPNVFIDNPVSAPGIALTPHPTLPNTWVGVAPNI